MDFYNNSKREWEREFLRIGKWDGNGNGKFNGTGNGTGNLNENLAHAWKKSRSLVFLIRKQCHK